MKKNLLLICGGAGTEHDISIISAKYLRSQIDQDVYNIIDIEINKDFEWVHYNEKILIDFSGQLVLRDDSKVQIDAVIPCIHGYPGETGDLQSFFEMIKVPYFGCNSETSKICFNKILTKLWLDKVGIKTTPFIVLNENNSKSISEVEKFFDAHGSLFIKASNQGSSVGCYPLHTKDKTSEILDKAFALSDFVLVEKELTGRELEVSTFEYQGRVHATVPGEIVCPSKFYTFEEKYDSDSGTKTFVEAQGLTQEQILSIQDIAKSAFTSLKLKDLSRIDFFLTHDGQILVNEINTFPGLTPISMFPKMMENYGVKFSDFITERLTRL